MASKPVAYGVGSVSGTILAVCSCTVLPLFSGIYRMGAGLGPATAFLYSGPAINVLAIVMTAKVLGVQLGLARAAAQRLAPGVQAEHLVAFDAADFQPEAVGTPVSYTHLRAHETVLDLVCRLLLEKKKQSY